MSKEIVPNYRQTIESIRAVVRIDVAKLDPGDAMIMLGALLALTACRMLLGPVIFTAGVAAFITLLLARRARHLWRVLLFVGTYGAIVTAIAQHVESRDAVALCFLGIVTFLSSLVILMPVTNTVFGLINFWAILAMSITPATGTTTASALSWFTGVATAVGLIWALRRRNALQGEADVDFTESSFDMHPAIRRNVLMFALGRATAVVAAGAIGVLLFPGNQWLTATTALVVIGINPERSRLSAIQRGLGTFLGVATALYVGGLSDWTLALVALMLASCYLAILLNQASPFFYALFLTCGLVSFAGLRSDAPIEMASGRIVETMIGVAIGLYAIRVLHPALLPIAQHLQEHRGVAASGT